MHTAFGVSARHRLPVMVDGPKAEVMMATETDGTPTGTGTPPEPKAPEKVFTQSELTAILEDRLARQAKKFDGFEDLKTKAAKFDELDAANKTELEKATQLAQAAQARADELAARLLDANIKSALATATAATADPTLVMDLAKARVVVADDGTITGIDEAVKAVLDAHPALRGQATTNAAPVVSGNGDGGPRKPAITPDLEQLDIAAYMKARAAK